MLVNTPKINWKKLRKFNVEWSEGTRSDLRVHYFASKEELNIYVVKLLASKNWQGKIVVTDEKGNKIAQVYELIESAKKENKVTNAD